MLIKDLGIRCGVVLELNEDTSLLTDEVLAASDILEYLFSTGV